ncbi:MAG: preprotein translocase subunit YajC [Muribaculaceae bacterium]|nr:preprotein translocase subunit YajC [Muribaculaceae bacterium]
MNTLFISLQAAGEQGGMGGLIMIALLFVVMWLFMIRPQQKRQKEIRKFREGLGKGDKIVTAGGIYGTITDVKEKYFVVEITKGVSISVDKGSVYPSAADAAQDAQQQEVKK